MCSLQNSPALTASGPLRRRPRQASPDDDLSAAEALVRLAPLLAFEAAVELRRDEPPRDRESADGLRRALLAAARAAGAHAARQGQCDAFLGALAEGGQAVLAAAKGSDDALDEMADTLRAVAEYIASGQRGARALFRRSFRL